SGGQIDKVTGIQGDINDFAESPDGRSIAFTGSLTTPSLSYSQSHLFVVSSAPGSSSHEVAAKSDLDVGGGVGGDQHPPRGGSNREMYWTPDGKAVIEAVAEKGNSNLRRFDIASGQITPMTSGNHDVMSWTATPDHSKVVVEISSPTLLNDLWVITS